MNASGKFEVTLSTVNTHATGVNGNNLGRMTIDKIFHGELAAESKGEMLSAMTSVKGSAGYVAIEQVSGSLQGKQGTFVLQHFGTMNDGEDRLILEVVPNSGTGELVGLSGQMNIRVDNGQHYYEFEYSL
ncbi:DUF3224 domain-containing protein [Parashewanella curva]|uniref:DUF3224 domain-containing protein n=1 Tax=Parashewanella curva TaxID=2338552 RepID=A0A3L8PW19_9GAMM|nr:DUF3224 domain-containing protein [Parashewanella curva]RLV59526.1 DUF3224 domain-containing protein [Parashewanella curva]